MILTPALAMLFWGAGDVIVAITAAKRGKSWIYWGIMSLFFSPLLTALVLALPEKRDPAHVEDPAPEWPVSKARTILTLVFIASAALVLDAVGALQPIFAPGFSDADVGAVKDSIKAEFEKREGTRVIDVQMIRETNKKLTGFVRMKLNGVPDDLTRSCTAVYGDQQYLWQCL